MSIKWKDRFKPTPVIERIASIRTYNEDGKISYSDLAIDACMPTLHSMLSFPSAAKEIDQETLVWRALNGAGKELTPDSFLKAANAELNKRLATKEIQYIVLTSISLSSQNFLKSISLHDCKIEFLKNDFPKKFIIHRQNLIKDIKTDTKETPSNYCKVMATVYAKSPGAAFNKAIQAIDLLRAIMCLISNPRMQITFGIPSHEAINTIRLGGHHTAHFPDGKNASTNYWYEPYFKPKSIYTSKNPGLMLKNIRWATKKIEKSNFKKTIISSLLMFVRGFDLHDQNAAFLKVWGALELLTTPNIADYDKLIRRTVFLFDEVDYQRQVLEHLRQYRNANVHAGEESENARIHCFQLQAFYSAMAWFYIRNGSNFTSLGDLWSFLDLPTEPSALKEQQKIIKRAIKFRVPR